MRLLLPVYLYSVGRLTLREALNQLPGKVMLQATILLSHFASMPHFSLYVLFFVACEEGMKALPEFFGPVGLAVSFLMTTALSAAAYLGYINRMFDVLVAGAAGWLVCAIASAIGYTPHEEWRVLARVSSAYFGIAEFVLYLAFAPEISLAFICVRFIPLIMHRLRDDGLYTGTIQHFYWNMMCYTMNLPGMFFSTVGFVLKYKEFPNLLKDLEFTFKYMLSSIRSLPQLLCQLPTLVLSYVRLVVAWAKRFAWNIKDCVILLFKKIVQILKRVLLQFRSRGNAAPDGIPIEAPPASD